MRKSVLVS